MSARPVLFLTGHRKSGTTLLARLFDDHHDVDLYVPDVSLFYAYFPTFAARLNDAAARARIESVVRQSFERQFRRLPKGVPAPRKLLDFASVLAAGLSSDALRRRGRFLAEFVDLWAHFRALPEDRILVLKETSQAACFLELREALGTRLRMLALLRDPRDNYAALKAGVMGYYAELGEGDRETLASALNRMRWDLLVAKSHVDTGVEGFATMRFEALVANPRAAMEEVCAFADIGFRPSMLVPTTFGHPYVGNNHDGQAFDGISAANLGRWRTRISTEEAQVIECWLGREMAAWSYEPESEPDARLLAFAEFYDWYNSRYFFSDSFDAREART